MRKVHHYSKEENEWLLENHSKFNTRKELTDEFNRVFGLNIATTAIRTRLLETLKVKPFKSDFSKEEDEWIVNNYSKFEYQKDLIKTFNEKFHKDYSNLKVRHHMNQVLHIKAFGQNYTRTVPNGTITPNAGCKGLRIKAANGNWVDYGKYLYEKEYGAIKKNEMILHLDGDYTNNDLSNLYKIDRKIHICLISSGFITSESKLTLAGIKYWELYYKLNGRKKIIYGGN